MARPATTFNKRDNEKKKQSKRLEKQKKKDERKISGKASSLDDMIAYVDENGMICDTPPDMTKKGKINQEDILVSVPKKEDEVFEPLKGRVEHFNDSKGYGFIKDLSGTDKHFFHISNAPADIEEGDIVFFELERGNRGMNAVNITKDPA